MKERWKRMKDALAGIYLVDRVLMLFMAVLFVCLTISLFDTASGSEESNSIDMVVRTSASAVFGYFISGNFLKSESLSKAEEKPVEMAPASSMRPSRIQVIVVSAIGMISLVLLLMARNFAEMTPEFAATVSQLRDFVAACVGFLVSCGKKQ